MPVFGRLVGAAVLVAGAYGAANAAERAEALEQPPQLIVTSTSQADSTLPITTSPEPPAIDQFIDATELVWEHKGEAPVVLFEIVTALGAAALVAPRATKRLFSYLASDSDGDGDSFFSFDFGGDGDGDGD